MEPSSKRAETSYMPGSALGHESDIGNLIEVKKSFAPRLYGGQITLPEGRSFTMSGQSPGAEDADEMAGIDVPNPLYPKEGDHPSQFIRLHMTDDETGVMVYVTPPEFQQYMAARGSFPRAPSLRGRSKGPRKMIPADDTAPDRADTKPVPAPSREDTTKERPPSE